jgi:Domain of unknown function (DUF4262)
MAEQHGHLYPLAEVHDVITARGWHDIHIDPPAPIRATCISTVGFALVGQPEIVCIGLPHGHVTTFVRQIYHRLSHQRFYRVGPIYTDLANLPMAFGTVSDRWKEQLCTVTADYYARYHGGLPFTAIQLIWADDKGLMPSDPRYNPMMRRSQTLLDETARSA